MSDTQELTPDQVKMELRTRLREIQKEFAIKNEELKKLEAESHKAAQLEKYKDYQFKVGCQGLLMKADTITELSDEHRLLGVDGQNTGVAYVDLNTTDGFCYVMLKTKEEYDRINTLFNRMHAADRLIKKEETNKELHLKVLLGEATYE
jgi:hypothetical protein